MPQRKSECTGAIFPSSRHELKAWQTGGVHVRSAEARAPFASEQHADPGIEGHDCKEPEDDVGGDGDALNVVISGSSCSAAQTRVQTSILGERGGPERTVNP